LKAKEPAKKYSLLSNIRFTIGLYRGHKGLVALSAPGVAMDVAKPFLLIMTPKIIIDLLEAGVSLERFMATVAVVAALMVSGFLQRLIDPKIVENFRIIAQLEYTFLRFQFQLPMLRSIGKVSAKRTLGCRCAAGANPA
jgi:ABC-type Co2+ transport system permease subunit